MKIRNSVTFFMLFFCFFVHSISIMSMLKKRATATVSTKIPSVTVYSRPWGLAYVPSLSPSYHWKPLSFYPDLVNQGVMIPTSRFNNLSWNRKNILPSDSAREWDSSSKNDAESFTSGIPKEPLLLTDGRPDRLPTFIDAVASGSIPQITFALATFYPGYTEKEMQALIDIYLQHNEGLSLVVESTLEKMDKSRSSKEKIRRRAAKKAAEIWEDFITALYKFPKTLRDEIIKNIKAEGMKKSIQFISLIAATKVLPIITALGVGLWISNDSKASKDDSKRKDLERSEKEEKNLEMVTEHLITLGETTSEQNQKMLEMKQQMSEQAQQTLEIKALLEKLSKQVPAQEIEHEVQAIQQQTKPFPARENADVKTKLSDDSKKFKKWMQSMARYNPEFGQMNESKGTENVTWDLRR